NPILISVADPRPAQVSPAFSNITCNSMTVSWSPVAGATSYRVRIKNPLTNSMFVNTVVTNTTYTKTGFTQNFTYEVWVTPIGCNNIAGFESQHFDVQICTGNVNPTGGATRIQQTAEEQDDMISFDNLPDFGEETLNIYPNPSSDKINITLNNSHSTQVMLNISDMTGRNIIRQSFSVTDGNLNEILDISTLPSGVYYVTITDKSIITRKKIVKE
ncbi:MAG: T9SS type A sorting domain-containing protein, partial [Bacteroidia bacterium]|nr:T9SS type A sorting domain-containing protein [Bacteroidia bacterium]